MMVGEINLTFVVGRRAFLWHVIGGSTSMFIIHIIVIFKYPSSYFTLISNWANKESLS